MKIMLNILKWALLVIVILILIVLIIVLFIRQINANKSKTNSKNGIQENIFVEINGIEQYMQIRGEDTDNPVILFLHGGPGFPLTYLSPSYQKGLEKDFTIVNLEQRGCGRTYYQNQSELSIELMLEDVDEVVKYIKIRFDCNKIIIMGQSWGSVLGVSYVHQHPENVLAYIGVGQVTNFDEGKIFSAKTAMELASEDDKTILANAIETFSTTKSIKDIDTSNLETMIITSLKYLKGEKEISGIKQMRLGISSPEMNLDDIKWFINASSTKSIIALEEPLINYMYFEFNINDLGYDFDAPVFFIQGSNDYITPTKMVEDYYNKIISPKKDFIIMDECGHTPFLDDPSTFTDKVLGILKDD